MTDKERAVLEAALVGFEGEIERIRGMMTEIRRRLGGAAITTNGSQPKPRRKMSAAARKRIAAAQRKRWAAIRKSSAN